MNKSIQTRPETGPMQFGDDWPGTFIRGDNAAYYALNLKTILEYVSSMDIEEIQFSRLVLLGLLSDLQSSEIPTKNIQQLKPFNECK
jgi:hypothetical protein